MFPTPFALMLLVVLPFASPFTYAGTHSSMGINQPTVGSSSSSSSSAASRGVVGLQMSRTASSSASSLAHPNAKIWKGGEHNATLPSRLFFRYTSPLLDTASHRELTEEDVFDVPQERKMSSAVPRLQQIYQQCRQKAMKKIHSSSKRKNRQETETWILLKALLIHQRRNILITGILRLLNTGVQAFPAILVARLLRLIEAGNEIPVSKPVLAAMALVSVLSVKMITENQYFHHIVKTATQTRGSVAGLIFDKSMKLPNSGSASTASDSSSAEEGQLGAGGILNLMQSDASILETTSLQLHTIWDGPLQIIMYTSLLYRYLGSSVLYGIAVLLCVIPINSITLRVLNKMRTYQNKAKDSRTKRTTEAISNMKLLKLQAWESFFGEDIQIHRNNELRRQFSRGIVRALNNAVTNAVPALVLVVTLTAYAKTGKPIVASTIFTAISLFNQLRFPLFFYPMLIDALANGRNALRRVSSYLSAEEITPYVQTLPPLEGGGGQIQMTNGNFLWSSAQSAKDVQPQEPTVAAALCGCDVTIRPGEVVAVVGGVGSGKSALIKGLLGELAPVPRAVVDPSLKNVTRSVLDKPTVVSNGNIAYCSQEPWLPKGTLRDAIVFGRNYDKQRYRAALRDAGLDDDIVEEVDQTNSKAAASSGVLSHNTDVGEGGSSLSGGQRARVALARALYAGEDTKVFLLDDPLAALDAAVGATVFERFTQRVRKSNAATVLVTNDPNIPRRCDRVILMGKTGEGEQSSCTSIVDVGTYDELLARGHDLRSLSAGDDEEEESKDIETESPPDNFQTAKNTTGGYIKVTNFVTGFNASCITHTQHADPDSVKCMTDDPNCIADQTIPTHPEIEVAEEKAPAPEETTGAAVAVTAATSAGSDSTRNSVKGNVLLSTDDKMEKGAVPLKTYLTYFRAVGSPLLIAAMLSSYLMANGAQFFQQYTVAKWTELGKGDAMAAALGGKYLRTLVNAAGVASIFLWLRSFLTMQMGINASKFVHNRMLKSVFGAPMSFFDATPSGQLLSRFGKEMETVDSSLPDGIGSVLFCFLQIFLSGAALSGVITPAMMIPIAVVGALYVRTMKRFRPAARDLKRAESRSRSPIYTHFGEALRGVPIIRSMPFAVKRWASEHRQLTDTNLQVFYGVKAMDRWLSIRLESLGNVVVLATAIVSVILTRKGILKSGSAGWGLTQALAITGLLTWAVRVLTDLESYMMSMVRLQEITDLESEETEGDFDQTNRMPKELSGPGDALVSLYSQSGAPLNISMAPLSDSALVESGWPWKGKIGFRSVSMRYNKLSPLVLKNVTITVPPGTTLGVVGRTGSGKSSLLLTLFRLVEIEGGGSIEIDGVDIRSTSLQTLRESLSIIPQDPVLFAGSLMYNLDATGKASQEDAWEALTAASPELAKQFRESGGLGAYIAEGGKNLSSGQRQLVCLARALLRKSKILVMDEATSAVDTKTDAQVQETIRREFVDKGVTVMTVAHRLDTVLGYDKIAVLGAGELLEYGTPEELLKIRNGELRRLVEADRQNKRKGAAATTKSPAIQV